MKNKKGFWFGEETLKIVIAVISIALLIVLGVKIYNFYNLNNEEKQAQATLEKLKGAVELKQEEFIVYNPKGWHILSWPLEEENIFPEICLKNQWKNCLCITKISINPSPENFAEESRICVEVSKKTIVMGGSTQRPITIYNPPIFLKINYDSEIIISQK